MHFLHKNQRVVIEYAMITLVIVMYRRIRDLRVDKDKSQTELAKYLNVSQSTYSRYESGELDIPSGVLIALSRYYHVSIDYLLNLTDYKN